jgi:hypothetical protein
MTRHLHLPTLALPPDVSLRSQDIERGYGDASFSQPLRVPDDDLHEVPMAMSRNHLSIRLFFRNKVAAGVK